MTAEFICSYFRKFFPFFVSNLSASQPFPLHTSSQIPGQSPSLALIVVVQRAKNQGRRSQSRYRKFWAETVQLFNIMIERDTNFWCHNLSWVISPYSVNFLDLLCQIVAREAANVSIGFPPSASAICILPFIKGPNMCGNARTIVANVGRCNIFGALPGWDSWLL